MDLRQSFLEANYEQRDSSPMKALTIEELTERACQKSGARHVERERRIMECYRSLLKQKTVTEIKRETMQKYGVSRGTAEKYIQEARCLIRDDWKLERREWIEEALDTLRKISEDSIACGQHSNAIGAVRLSGELLQLLGGKSKKNG